MGSHDWRAFCGYRGFPSQAPAHDKRNQRVCRGYQRFPPNLTPYEIEKNSSWREQSVLIFCIYGER